LLTRGSGSLRKEELKDLGGIHFGRRRDQPTREELRKFYREADRRLDHQPFWFREDSRRQIADAFGDEVQKRCYTVWACAICSNHAHVVVRTHQDRSEAIWNYLAAASSDSLRRTRAVPIDHPIWSHRIYKVFLYTPFDVCDRIRYVNENPLKEGLAAQSWVFVQPYGG
jgi:REP element-mobilizing transposase RayT